MALKMVALSGVAAGKRLSGNDREICAFFSVFINFSMFLIFCLWIPPALGQDSVDADFQKSVLPVPLTLQAGTTFQESSLPPQNTGRGWYRIPSWFAGNWHRREILEKRFGFPDRRVLSLRDMHRGYQVDHRGDIWHPRNEPFVVRVDHGDTYDLNDTSEMKPLMVTPDRVVLEITAIGLRINKANGLILATTQKKEIHTFKPGRNRTLEVESEGMGYDQLGQPLLDKPFHKYYTEFLKGGFKPIRYEDGRDYYNDFCLYLESTNQGDLLPR